MDDLTATLERAAARGEPRGAHAVLRSAYARIDEGAALIDVTEPEHPRRRRLVLAGALASLVIALMVWQVVADDRGGPVVTTPASRDRGPSVPGSRLGALPSGFDEVARGSEGGSLWILGARRSNGVVRVRLVAAGVAGGVTTGPRPVEAVTVRGRAAPSFTFGMVPGGTAVAKITFADETSREVAAEGDATRYGVRFFASVDARPANDVRRVDALAADGRTLGLTFLGSPGVPRPPDVPVDARRVSTRIELPSRKLVAGRRVAAALVVTNRSGAALQLRTGNGCKPDFALVVGNDDIPQQAAFDAMCEATPFVVPQGRTRFPFSLHVTYHSCDPPPNEGTGPTCTAAGAPALPPGRYRVSFQDAGTGLPRPKPVPVRVVRALRSSG